MNIQDIEAAIEAVLFSVGESIELIKIAEVVDLDIETTKRILEQMMDHYNLPGRGISLIEIEGKYQLCSKRKFYEHIKRATQKVIKFELTDVVIETLSIIAYKQPVTKLHIEQVRGVKSDHAVNKLVEYGLIEERGRLDTPGRPILFGTTEAFLRSFGLSSMDELPSIGEKQLEVIRHEVEEEMQLSFDETQEFADKLHPKDNNISTIEDKELETNVTDEDTEIEFDIKEEAGIKSSINEDDVEIETKTSGVVDEMFTMKDKGDL